MKPTVVKPATYGPVLGKWRFAPQVTWAVDLAGITVIHSATGCVASLEYHEAALWDLLSRGYSYDRLIALVCAIASLEPQDAEQWVLTTTKEWTEAGLLVKVSDHG